MTAKKCPKGTRSIRGRCIPREDVVKQKVVLTKMAGNNPWWEVQKVIVEVESGEVISVRRSDVVKGKQKALGLKKEWSKIKDPDFRRWML